MEKARTGWLRIVEASVYDDITLLTHDFPTADDVSSFLGRNRHNRDVSFTIYNCSGRELPVSFFHAA